MRESAKALFFVMKYYYQKPNYTEQLYGERIILNHPVYKIGTLFIQNGSGLVIVQKRFTAKYAYWDAIDPWLANDIYLHPAFQEYFRKNSRSENFQIIPIRKVMWALRMKPLPKEYWEDYI